MDSHQENTSRKAMLDSDDEYTYFIFRLRECGFRELFVSFLRSEQAPGVHVSKGGADGMLENSWQGKFAMLILKLLHLIAHMLGGLGEFIEVFMNTLHVNGGLLGIISRIISGKGIEVPDEHSDAYLSVIGFLDPRTDLLIQQLEEKDPSFHFANQPPASKLMADISIMASKVAYENEKVINKVISTQWKMHLVGIYKGINRSEPTNPTQVLIFIDRAQDAQAIVVTFRGTMPFNAYDWSTDFDFSWYELPGIGRVHVGFMEALSLVDRHDMESFARLRLNMSEFKKTGKKTRPTSGLVESPDTDANKQVLAYDTACETVKQLLKQHKNARVYVTGHSLGGALAAVFTAMLFHNDEGLVTDKLAALYTFGQPRVGDRQFAATMSRKLNGSQIRFFRVVYSSDLVARIPFDNILFQFRHTEPCILYNSFYKEKIVGEEPNKNYFSPLYFIWNHGVAVFELVQSFVLHYMYGEGYREFTAATVLRIVGLKFPGMAAHSPVNYVNSVRLGPDMLA